MVIVTARDSTGRAGGCLCGFTSQCSIDPPRLVVWISRANATYPIAVEAEILAVHAATDRRRDLARWFGEVTGDDLDKLAPLARHPGPEGSILLDGLPDVVIGRVVHRIVLPDGAGGADHEGFVLEPLDVRVDPDSDQPLRLQATLDLEPGHPAAEPGS